MNWSYQPYKPYFFETGDIYVCRISPRKSAFTAQWLPLECKEYSVFIKKRDGEDFSLYKKTQKPEIEVSGLEDLTDYEFYVEGDGKRSRVRLVRTGETVGITVNYLHPEDAAYSFSGQYLCSPSLVRHPDGYLLASMDVYKGHAPQNLNIIFRSDDEGQTWQYVSELMPSFWGKLFVHKNALYMLSCSTEYGDLLIGRSDDGGKTFTQPTVLLRGSGGKEDTAGVHKNPQNVMRHNGRLYFTIEWGSWSTGFAPTVISIDENDDLTDASKWAIPTPVPYDPTWEGVAKGASVGNIEGTLVISPEGELLNIMRYDTSKTEPRFGLVLAYVTTIFLSVFPIFSSLLSEAIFCSRSVSGASALTPAELRRLLTTVHIIPTAIITTRRSANKGTQLKGSF